MLFFFVSLPTSLLCKQDNDTMTIGAEEGLLLGGTRKVPQLHALGMEHVAAPRHHLAIEVCDYRPRTDGASRLVEKQVHFLEKVLNLLHGTRAACTQDGRQSYI